jgi:hydrogenase maturation protease
MAASHPVVLAGLGNEYRRDDGAGQVVAGVAAGRLPNALYLGSFRDPLDLCHRWDRAQAAVIVDAVSSGAAPGAVHVVQLLRGTSLLAGARASTHGFGLPSVLQLGSAVGLAPERVVLVGVEGRDFGFGPGLSPAVQAAVPLAVCRVVSVVEELLTCV